MNRSEIARRALRNRAQSSFASAIEQLESRTLLTAVVVTTPLDNPHPAGLVSLRDAVNIANTSTTPTTITFSPAVFGTSKTITLGGTQLTLSNVKEPTTITGPSVGVTVSGGNKSRILAVASGTTAVVTGIAVVSGRTGSAGGGIITAGVLTLKGVSISNCSSGSATGYGAGGIQNQGRLTMTDVTISGNTSFGSGGGFENWGAASRTTTATLTDVTIDQNKTLHGRGGGINTGTPDNIGQTTLILRNVTIAGNFAPTSGGGIYLDGGNSGSSLIGVTVSGNSASGTGGGIQDAAGPRVTLGNVLVAGNHAGSSPDVAGKVSSLGHNFVGVAGSGSGWIASDFTGTIAKPLNANLGPLANNGGPTQTMLPLAGSLAIDHGSNSLIPTGIINDQRGLTRIVDRTVDIGAVEVQPFINFAVPTSQTAVLGVSKSVTLGSFTAFAETTPYKLDVNWGDGSADTIISLTAPGALPATAHKFIKAGLLKVIETITDAKGHKSNTAMFNDTVTTPKI